LTLLRSSAAQSGFFNRLSFLLGASFIYLLLTVIPSYAEETSTVTIASNSTVSPSTSTSTEPVPSPTQEPTSEPSPTLTPQPTSDSSAPTGESSPSSGTSSTQEAVVEPSPSVSTEPSPESTQQPSPAENSTTTTTSTDTPPAVTSQPTPPPVVTETITGGGDDTSYRIPLETTVMFNGVEYTDVYATTNSVITFGQPDGTFHTYPNTPSISIESRDWWALPHHMPDTHFIIRTSEGGFQVDGKYRPYGSMTGETTQIVITGQILTDGTVSYTYSVEGRLFGDERTRRGWCYSN
jgi:hypothetical protein